MATSSLACSALRDLESGEANNEADVEYNLALIRNALNALLNTATGHYHDGTDSRLISSGITGWDFEAMFLLMYGMFGRGGL